ncbi:MAG: YggU family protein [Gemmatimonadota bacterium]|nr:MAG: YggU family protein [Gemmatimonadota bacterium]
MTVLAFHIQPGAKATEIVGWHGDAIKVRLRAPPVAGAANDELVRFLARQADVPLSAVTIVNGRTSRRKRVSIEGVSRADVLRAAGLEDR